MGKNGRGGPASSLNLGGGPTAPTIASTTRTPTPRASNRGAGGEFAAKADSIGLGGPKTNQTEQFAPRAAQALAGSNHDVVANRRAIRMANMSAAEVLKAELAGLVPVKPSANSFSSPPTPAIPTPQQETNGDIPPAIAANMAVDDEDNEVPGLGTGPNLAEPILDLNGDEGSATFDMPVDQASPHGTKRKHDVVEAEDEEVDAEETIVEEDDEDDTDAAQATNYALKVNPDGTVEQEDTVRYVIRSCIFHIIFIDLRCRLWESGYRERYYKQKFGVAYSDVETRKKYTVTPSTFRSISCEF